MSRYFGKIRQLGFVVRNIDESLERFNRLGIGPFFRMDHLKLDYLRVNGQDADLDLSLAIAYSGDVQYELVEQHNAVPSPYKEFLDSNGEGLHHFCTWSDDLDADLARWTADGHRVVIDGQIGGARFVYMDSEMFPGAYVEVAEITAPHWLAIMKKMEDAAAGWDGTNPVRPFSDLMEE